MSRTASVETVNRGEHSCVHPTPKMIDPKIFSLFSVLFHLKKITTLVWGGQLHFSFIMNMKGQACADMAAVKESDGKAAE